MTQSNNLELWNLFPLCARHFCSEISPDLWQPCHASLQGQMKNQVAPLLNTTYAKVKWWVLVTGDFHLLTQFMTRIKQCVCIHFLNQHWLTCCGGLESHKIILKSKDRLVARTLKIARRFLNFKNILSTTKTV